MRCMSQILRREILVVTLGVLVSGCSDHRPVPNVGLQSPFDASDPMSRAMREKGLQLRAEIDDLYIERPAHATDKRHQAELQHIVERFVPIGMPFDRAKRLLGYAGFTLALSNNHHPSLYASITPYAKTFPSTDLGISLYPTDRFKYLADPSSIDWTLVRGVSASLIVIWP